MVCYSSIIYLKDKFKQKRKFCHALSLMLMEGRVKLYSLQNISEASQQNSVEAFS